MKTIENMTNVEKINKVIGNNRRYISEVIASNALKSEYNKKAISFLIETDTTCDIELIGLRNTTWGSKRDVNAYNVTLKNAKHSYTFEFFDSINNTEKNKSARLDFYSVLVCMRHYIPESFDEFCSDFGYEFKNETEYIKAKGIHLACLDQDKNLKKLFTDEQLTKLQEIN